MAEKDRVYELNQRLKKKLERKTGWGRAELNTLIDETTIEVLSESVKKQEDGDD